MGEEIRYEVMQRNLIWLFKMLTGTNEGEEETERRTKKMRVIMLLPLCLPVPLLVLVSV